MTMQSYMNLQLVGIICAYFGLTLALPAILLHKKLHERRTIERITYYFVFGNFFIMNLVFLLQLIRLSNKVTLILGTLIPSVILWAIWNEIPIVQSLPDFSKDFKRVMLGQMGPKTVLAKFSEFRKKRYDSSILRFFGWVRSNWLECILCIAMILSLLYVYGSETVSTFGYSAQDIPVHNKWINALSDNNLFVSGIYPMGFHCIIYYLHTVFGFETYILLSLFAFIQVVCFSASLFFFMKLVCRNKFIPYTGMALYLLGSFWRETTYSRFASTLPQEFGMVFIFPPVFYAITYFKNQHEAEWGAEDTLVTHYSVTGFVMAFACTFMIHFYNTVIAGLFCIALALGYFTFMIHRKVLMQCVHACLLALFIGMLPMAICLVNGAKLEPSMYWGAKVITGGTIGGAYTPGAVIDSDYLHETGGVLEDVYGSAQEYESAGLDTPDSAGSEQSDKKVGIFTKFRAMGLAIGYMINEYVLLDPTGLISKGVLFCLILLLVGAIVEKIDQERCYGSTLLSVFFYICILSLLLASGPLGLPRLMDSARCGIYFAYSTPILIILTLDFIISLVDDKLDLEKWVHIIPLALLGFVVGVLLLSSNIRAPYQGSMLATNEAVTCLTNIIRNEEDYKWTIISAGDELQMGWDHGYHYEISEFLHGMENMNRETSIYIPTEKVFFFVEKKPLGLSEVYAGETTISENGAKAILPPIFAGSTAYTGYNRWVYMSRMYYWANAFMKIYPGDIAVYYETDNLVCYELTQNVFHLFNLAINYGYNNVLGE